MKIKFWFRVRCLLLASSFYAGCGASALSGQALVTKHPQGIAVAQHSLTAMAPSGLQAYRDSRAVGSVTLYGPEPKTFPITLETKGTGEARTEIQLSDGLSTFIVNHGQAVVQHGGQLHRLLENNMVGWQPRHLPALSLLSKYNDVNTSVEHLGSESVSGSAADIVAVAFSPSSDPVLIKHFQRMSRTTFAVDQASGLVTRVNYPVFLESRPREQREVAILYSDYRVVQGIMVPFHQTRYVNGKIREELQLQSIEFNVGLQDSEFSLPEVK